MFKAARWRLTAWYVAVLSLALIAFSFGVYTLLARAARRDLDRALAGAIDVLARSLRHEIDEHEGKAPGERSFVDQVLGTVYRDSFPGIAIAVFEDRRLVGAKPGPDGLVPPPQAAAELEFRNVKKMGSRWRMAIEPVHVAGAGSYQFVAMASQEPVETALAGLRRTLFIAVPLALAVAAWGGVLLARKSLAPAVAMAEQQRQFMADASHELRTPIYVAHTAAQVMLERDGRPEADYREALAAIDQQLKRLQQIVEDMFVLARADAGAYPLQLTQFDLGETVEESVRAARVLAQPHGIQVAGPLPAELPCQGDERLVRQLLMILLDNAVKYTPRGGRVNVTIDLPEPQTYRVAVSDTGPGIPVEAQAHIFDRFYRADAARSGGAGKGGAGLGLAIAKWIAEIHGGKLALEHSGPEGTTFALWLPREAANMPSPAS
jgi:signal transduction histidine kinase